MLNCHAHTLLNLKEKGIERQN